MTLVEEIHEPNGPLGFLPDLGDRLVVAQALLSNIPAILTTDRKSFWKHSDKITDLGVQVMRPRELLKLYDPYWKILGEEFEHRRAMV